MALYSNICCENNLDFENNFLGVLPGLHTFSGCDSTSACYWIGKRMWLNMVNYRFIMGWI